MRTRHIAQHALPARRALSILAMVLGVGVVIAGGIEFGEHMAGANRNAALSAKFPTQSASDATGSGQGATSPAATASTASSAHVTPIRIRIAALGVDAVIQKLYLTSTGTLSVPTQTNQAGWYTGGAVPGQPGPAVIAGHLDSMSGAAVFYGLDRLQPGDVIIIELSTKQTVRYAVTGTQVTLKTQFPTAEVYGPTPDAELRLVTCTGDLVDGSYLDNLIVFATLKP
ncbi:class F sortase [Actinospica durhamensis]|uniref:Class F sortase n=1 Tax=Actinospica durhamensis TaxID=1508375 RepID=A0A941IQW4_9ACTN|nr:sortase [Actinospica durhamensis]MBR7834657.1 class F sortase [Actinospica durhamensis]